MDGAHQASALRAGGAHHGDTAPPRSARIQLGFSR
jgi:hypothetical protein